MPKMKWGSDIDWRGLNDAEYSDDEFETYDGPVPPKNIILSGVVKKIWATETANGDAMLKVLFEAAGNSGDRKVYNGCGIWDNVLFTMPQVKFKWQPFFDAIGITLADVKNKTLLADTEEDRMGAPIARIGTVKFPEAGVPIRVKTDREKYEDEWQARVGKFLPPADASDDVDGDDEYDEDDGEDDPF
jgi:hypothetical protein